MNDLRDYFAAQAMPLALQEYRMCTHAEKKPMDVDWGTKYGLSVVARMAYEFADAMMEARKNDGTAQ